MWGLGKKERDDIFSLFTRSRCLRFAYIEKQLGIRSNMVAYHLERMISDGLLVRTSDGYSLTELGERYIPLFSTQISALPVILVAVANGDKLLLLRREKRPYKGYWGLVGGRLHMNESFEEASVRLVKQKAGVDCAFDKMCSVAHEHVHEEGQVKHGFILLLTKVTLNPEQRNKSLPDRLQWFSRNELEHVIPSDAWLIRNKLGTRVDIPHVQLHELSGTLVDFVIR